jgi:hypothetical protein
LKEKFNMKLLRIQVLIAVCILSLLSCSANSEDHDEEFDELYESEIVDDGSNTCAAVFGGDAAACQAVSTAVQCVNECQLFDYSS